jgi:hypothetical protein
MPAFDDRVDHVLEQLEALLIAHVKPTPRWGLSTPACMPFDKEYPFELLTSLSLANISGVNVLRISDLCLSVKGGNSVKVMYLNSSCSWDLQASYQAAPSATHQTVLGSISGRLN